MSDSHASERDKLGAVQALWDVHRRILLNRGVDLNKISAEWAARQKQKLPSPGAQKDFAELCGRGCTPQVLATILWLLRFSPRAAAVWDTVLGDPKRRQRTKRIIDRAAKTLEDVFKEFMVAENAELQAMGRVPLSSIVSELRLYGDLLNLAEQLKADTEAHSVAEVSKYLLAGYVKRATGRFRDRNVSALLAEVVGPPCFDEVAQRMWRSRNYQRLDKHFWKFADFLGLLGTVISRQK